jgi:hypothetical protein
MARSTFMSILEAAKTQIVSLDLPEITDAAIKILKVFNEREVNTVRCTMPGILLFPLGPETMDPSSGTICNDDIGYPVAVAMLDSEMQDTADSEPACAETGAPDQEYNFDRKMFWREQIRKKFFHQRLSGVASVYTCHVEPLPMVDEVAWTEDYGGMWISMLLLRFMSRETRTT